MYYFKLMIKSIYIFLVLIKDSWKSALKNEAQDLAAEGAFYFFLGLFPFLIFLTSILGLIGQAHDNFNKLIFNLSRFLPYEVLNTVNTYLYSFVYKVNHKLFSLSFLFLLWTASVIGNSIIKSVSRAYRLNFSKKWFLNRLYAIFLILGITILIFILSVLYILLPTIEIIINKFIPNFAYKYILYLINAVRLPIAYAILLFGVVFLYLFAVRFKISVKYIWPGAMITSGVLILLNWLFSLYIIYFSNYSKVYGSLSAIIIFLLWLQGTIFVFIFGCEFNYQLILYHLNQKEETNEQGINNKST